MQKQALRPRVESGPNQLNQRCSEEVQGLEQGGQAEAQEEHSGDVAAGEAGGEGGEEDRELRPS